MDDVQLQALLNRYAELKQEEIQNAKTGRDLTRPEPFRGRCIACVES